jgi:hypothetical protein
VHNPTAELLKRQDVAALDVPTMPRPVLNRIAMEVDPAYRVAPGFYAVPAQGRLHPALDPDADVEARYDQYPESM